MPEPSVSPANAGVQQSSYLSSKLGIPGLESAQHGV
jgi:hypothetical protein